MATGQEKIYALTHWIDGKEIAFYVGRTKRDEGIRFAEHRRNALTRNEAVYRYIRDHVLCGIFEEEVLCECKDENIDDYEGFYVIKLLREGQPLQNMKMGDAKKIAEQLEMAASDYVFNTPSDLRKYREEKQRKTLHDKQRLLDAAARVAAQERNKPQHKQDYSPFVADNTFKYADDPVANAAFKSFEAGKYTQALSLLKNSHTRFYEMFGITYLEAISV